MKVSGFLSSSNKYNWKMRDDRCYLCKEASNQKSLESGPPPKCQKVGVSKGGQ